MIGGADGPLTRRDPVQVPAFVAEESTNPDQPRTLVLGGTSPDEVAYTLVRGSGGRLGDAELTAAADNDPRLDKVVAHLVAGSGADQTQELSGFAIRYVLVRDGAPRQMSRVLDATPGLNRLSQLDGSALWSVDRDRVVARATIVPAAKPGDAAKATDAAVTPIAVASGPVEAHAKIPSGPAGRVLRIADHADEGWTATLDGKELNKTTVDGWAQGFELPAEGGKLDLTYDQPFTHTLWIWAQVGLAVVLLVLALPGRRREIDDDLPEEEVVIPAQAMEGDGRRARRLRAAAEAEAAATVTEEAAPEQEPVPVPQEQTYAADWDGQYDPAYAQQQQQQQQEQEQYAQQGYYSEYAADPYQQQYPQQYDQPYEQQQYDPYQQQGYEQQQPQQQPYEEQQPYDPYTYGYETDQRPDGSSNQ